MTWRTLLSQKILYSLHTSIAGQRKKLIFLYNSRSLFHAGLPCGGMIILFPKIGPVGFHTLVSRGIISVKKSGYKYDFSA